MPALTSSDVTVTVSAGTPMNPMIVQTQRFSVVTIAFGDGVLTYPADGVPVPGYANFGFTRNLKTLFFTDDASASALQPKWDKTNQKVRLYNPGAEVLAGAAVPALTIEAIAVGW